ncbi:MAG: biopolymer transporter ExbD [Dysgonamonadaceae bacterium]|nr:biopolymer transporter ExbD [Dysgonamonadaceae bacterium]
MRRKLPSPNTAALPDLIFTLLFFFMMVNNMRSVPVLTDCELPSAARLRQLEAVSELIRITVGYVEGDFVIRFNSSVCGIGELDDRLQFFLGERAHSENSETTVILKIDRRTPMRTVNDIRSALRRNGLLTVFYAADEHLSF